MERGNGRAMVMLQEPRLSIFAPCTYLPERMWRFEYFFAYNISAGGGGNSASTIFAPTAANA